jgi:hypothetical protein
MNLNSEIGIVPTDGARLNQFSWTPERLFVFLNGVVGGQPDVFQLSFRKVRKHSALSRAGHPFLRDLRPTEQAPSSLSPAQLPPLDTNVHRWQHVLFLPRPNLLDRRMISRFMTALPLVGNIGVQAIYVP